MCHVHGGGMRMPRLHGRQKEGEPDEEALAAALSCCCVLVRRCVARGHVHGDATSGICQVSQRGGRAGRKEGARDDAMER